MHRDKGRWMPTGFAVIGMGKLGGGELNYSSDVDVIYVYEADDGRTHPGRSSQERSIPNEEYFEYLARGLTKALTEQTQEGIVFRVDLRLRAEGTVGQLARSLSQYRQYYRTRGQDWERQALLKAWPVAGDPRVGRAFVRMVRPFIFNADEPAGLEAAGVIGGIKAVKSMIDDVMERRGHARRNVKLGTGGIREIEFMVQAVQLLCGRRLPRIVHRNTLTSLIRFRRAGLISQAEQRALNDAYLFLRNVEHKLQMVHDLQTHALPESMDQLLRCAIRLGYSPADHGLALRRFMDDYRIHTARVNRMFRSLVDTPDRCSILKMALRKAKAMGRAARRSKELSVGGK
jgi:glutamate-ammonia-ligase adenylyltransferase